MDTEQARMRAEEYAHDTYEGARGTTDEMGQTLVRTIRERPMIAGGIALASGLIIGSVVAMRRRAIAMEERRPINVAKRVATNSLGTVMNYLADAVQVGAEYFSNRIRGMAP